ncbi:hypothetical protein EJ02DRAFT_428213 [Clathrospora elynae]|uniref:Uncharacterized protein n=1 Tax=Clathrospora elynae TaxID=706981 RepID=A0A6A5SB56_9PLEO|nr:hypothetical protein EJ02DRAFT_428213 [Clathrospora elynae]
MRPSFLCSWTWSWRSKAASIADFWALPSDDIRLALVRNKDRTELEKSRRQAGGEGSDDITALTKLLIVGQLKQLTQNAAPVPASAPAAPEVVPPMLLPAWVLLEYTHWHEILEHTLAFWKYWQKDRGGGCTRKHIIRMFREVVIKARLHINMIMDNSKDGVTMDLWVNYLGFEAGSLLQLRETARQWRQKYTGLGEEAQQRVEDVKRQERDDDVVEEALQWGRFGPVSRTPTPQAI